MTEAEAIGFVVEMATHRGLGCQFSPREKRKIILVGNSECAAVCSLAGIDLSDDMTAHENVEQRFRVAERTLRDGMAQKYG